MKYNDNGTVKELKVKAFDTLPVGAIVEYSGSTIPSGWTDIGNNQIQKTSQYIEGGAGLPSYFTDEIDTGMKWIDGKPIYRKVIIVNSPIGTGTILVPHGINDFNDLINCTGEIIFEYDSTTFKRKAPLFILKNNFDINLIVTQANITLISTHSTAQDISLVIILEYTKTTD